MPGQTGIAYKAKYGRVYIQYCTKLAKPLLFSIRRQKILTEIMIQNLRKESFLHSNNYKRILSKLSNAIIITFVMHFFFKFITNKFITFLYLETLFLDSCMGLCIGQHYHNKCHWTFRSTYGSYTGQSII